ncbi:Uncharacterized protein APZ42_002778, partial [Daphnia magna]
MAHPAAAPHRQWLCLLQPAPQRGPGRRHPDGQSRRQAPGRPAPAALHHRHAQAGLEQERDRPGPGQRIPGAAGVHQHLPRAIGPQPLAEPVPGARIQPAAGRALQPRDCLRVRARARLPDP